MSVAHPRGNFTHSLCVSRSLGLHWLLFYAMQCDSALFLDETILIQRDTGNTPELDIARNLSRLQEDLSGPAVVSLANKVVDKHGSPALQRVNCAFDAWRTIWDLRHYRERDHEDRTFFNDPLPFWWLGKLYMILHCCSHFIANDSEFATWKVDSSLNEAEKLQVHLKLRRWMALFRDGRSQADTSTQNHLTKVLGITPNG